jgi:hypothetical protein
VTGGGFSIIAIMLAAIWTLSALLALGVALRAGALLDALVAAIIGGSILPGLGELLFQHEACVRRYGAAAAPHVPQRHMRCRSISRRWRSV